MFNKFMQWLVPKLEASLKKKGKYVNIYGHKDSTELYLIRYFLFRSKYFSIYIHRFMRSDVGDPHDHPFNFLGYVVKGGYIEELWPDPYPYGHYSELSERKQGSWAWRPAKTTHMVHLDKERLSEDQQEAPLTIIFRGRQIRDWGFWRWQSVGRVWVLWHQYLGIDPSDNKE